MRALSVASFVAAAALFAACRATTDFVLHRPARSVVLSPVDTTIVEGRTFRLRVTVLDDRGDTIPEVVSTFQSTDITVVAVTADGMVMGVGAGWTAVEVHADSASGFTRVTVSDSSILVHLRRIDY